MHIFCNWASSLSGYVSTRHTKMKGKYRKFWRKFTCIARCDVAQAVGEKAAQIGDNALRRVGPAANGEATQFGEQGGRFGSTTCTTRTDSAAAARCGAAVVSFLGRHVHVAQVERESSKLAKSFNALSYVKAQLTLARKQAHSHTHTHKLYTNWPRLSTPNCVYRSTVSHRTPHTLVRLSAWPEKKLQWKFVLYFSRFVWFLQKFY